MNVTVLASCLLLAVVDIGSCPRVWMSYVCGKDSSILADAPDLRSHGVEVLDFCEPGDDVARSNCLAELRASGLKASTSIPDVTERAETFRRFRLKRVPARMLGGVYNGIAIDRSLFRFTAARHSILIEPPVYSCGCKYRRKKASAKAADAEKVVGHYYPGISDPVRAEIVVPLKLFDGRQHLKIVPATVSRAAENAVPSGDSTRGIAFPDRPEVKNRRLWRLDFDLTGLDKACLSQIGIAVYWELGEQDEYWMFQNGQSAPSAETTRECARLLVNERLGMWAAANKGVFPSDVLVGLRLGDECFNLTGHLSGRCGSYPVWDFSEAGIAAFHRYAGEGLEYPRTWGYPEVYGEDAYGCWLYSYHKACAEILAVQRKAAHAIAPGIRVFRNTTRGGVWWLPNEFDGSSQELDIANLDIVNPDPYPVSASGYANKIPMDMSYVRGIARRYGTAIVPWLQAHVYDGTSGTGKGLVHPTADQVDKMLDEHLRFAPDGIMWLGYGKCRPKSRTFPDGNPASWDRAGERQISFKAWQMPDLKAKVALLRHYNKRAIQSRSMDGGHRGPADLALRIFAEEWLREGDGLYDVFEIPPRETPEDVVARGIVLRQYRHVVADFPYPGAWDVTTCCPDAVKALSKDIPRIRENIREKIRLFAD